MPIVVGCSYALWSGRPVFRTILFISTTLQLFVSNRQLRQPSYECLLTLLVVICHSQPLRPAEHLRNPDSKVMGTWGSLPALSIFISPTMISPEFCTVLHTQPQVYLSLKLPFSPPLGVYPSLENEIWRSSICSHSTYFTSAYSHEIWMEQTRRQNYMSLVSTGRVGV